MSALCKPTVLIALLLSAGAAQAQASSYCAGMLVANSFYNEVQSTGPRSVVTYFMQLQNRTGKSMSYTLHFTVPSGTELQNGAKMATLAAYQQVTVKLGKQTLNNPTGTGALSATDKTRGTPRYTTIQCM